MYSGMVAYVKNDWAKKFTNIKNENSHLLFRLGQTPTLLLAGIYMQHESPEYLDNSYSRKLTPYSMTAKDNFIPFIGGDFNAQIGNIHINMLSP